MLDAMRGYLRAASGLTELTRKRAQELAQSLLATGGASSAGAVAAQVSSVAEELINTAKSNRAAVREMVRGEVEVAVARLGLVPSSELDRARRKIATLEATVAELQRSSAGNGTASDVGSAPSPTSRAASGSRPNRAAVKKAATATAGTKTATEKTATKKTATKKTATKKTATKKTAAKKTAAKTTSAARRTTPATATAGRGAAAAQRSAVKGSTQTAANRAERSRPVQRAAGTDSGAETSS